MLQICKFAITGKCLVGVRADDKGSQLSMGREVEAKLGMMSLRGRQ